MDRRRAWDGLLRRAARQPVSMTLRMHLDGSGKLDTLVRAVSPEGRWAVRTSPSIHGGFVGTSPAYTRAGPDAEPLVARALVAGQPLARGHLQRGGRSEVWGLRHSNYRSFATHGPPIAARRRSCATWVNYGRDSGIRVESGGMEQHPAPHYSCGQRRLQSAGHSRRQALQVHALSIRTGGDAPEDGPPPGDAPVRPALGRARGFLRRSCRPRGSSFGMASSPRHRRGWQTRTLPAAGAWSSAFRTHGSNAATTAEESFPLRELHPHRRAADLRQIACPNLPARATNSRKGSSSPKHPWRPVGRHLGDRQVTGPAARCVASSTEGLAHL